MTFKEALLFQYMNNGWLKLHRKLQESPIWQDPNAWRVFEWLLMNVDYQTGVGTFGRNQIAQGTGLKPNTAYKVTTRLHEKYQVLSLQSNNKFTTISVLNWAKYQHDEKPVTGTVKVSSHVTSKKSNTIKEYKELKNKELKKESIEKENHSLTYLENLPLEDIYYFTTTWELTETQLKKKALQLADYCRYKNKKYSNYKSFLRNAVSKDFKIRPVYSIPPIEQIEIDPDGIAKVQAIKNQLMGELNPVN